MGVGGRVECMCGLKQIILLLVGKMSFHQPFSTVDIFHGEAYLLICKVEAIFLPIASLDLFSF